MKTKALPKLKLAVLMSQYKQVMIWINSGKLNSVQLEKALDVKNKIEAELFEKVG